MTSTWYLNVIKPPGTFLMLGKASSGTLTAVVIFAIRVAGSIIRGATACERSFRKTLHEPAEDNDRPPSPVFDRG
jgi:hypothetical protein